MAPEYYVSYDAEGKAVVNWDALGEGASFRIPMVVDKHGSCGEGHLSELHPERH